MTFYILKHAKKKQTNETIGENRKVVTSGMLLQSWLALFTGRVLATELTPFCKINCFFICKSSNIFRLFNSVENKKKEIIKHKINTRNNKAIENNLNAINVRLIVLPRNYLVERLMLEKPWNTKRHKS